MVVEGLFATSNGRIELDASKTTTDSLGLFASTESDGEYKLQWGYIYVPGTTGIFILIRNFYDVSHTPQNYHRTVIITPWGSYDSGEVSGYVNPYKILITWTNRDFGVDGDCNSVLIFDSLIFEEDTGSGYSTVLSIGPQTLSESGFKKTENYTLLKRTKFFSPFNIAASQSCSGSAAAQPTRDYTVTADVLGGYRDSIDGVTWLYGTIDFYNPTYQSTGCSCQVSPNYGTAINSWEIGLTGEDEDVIAITDHGTAGYCGGSVIFAHWTIEETVQYNTSSVQCVDRNYGINNLRVRTTATCDGITATPYDSGTIDTTPITYSLENYTNVNSVFTGECYVQTAGGACIPPATPPAGSSTSCNFSGSALTNYEEEPPCTGHTIVSPDNIHFSQSGEYFWSNVIDADIFVYRSQLNVPYSGLISTSQVTTDQINGRPALWISKKGILYVAYDDGTDVLQRFSTDWGKTWSEPVTILAGCINVRIAPGPNNERLVAGFKYDSGSSGPGKIRVIGTDGGGVSKPEANALLWNGSSLVDLSVDSTGHDITFQNGSFIMICSQTGSLANSILSSKDYGYTWTDITV